MRQIDDNILIVSYLASPPVTGTILLFVLRKETVTYFKIYLKKSSKMNFAITLQVTIFCDTAFSLNQFFGLQHSNKNTPFL